MAGELGSVVREDLLRAAAQLHELPSTRATRSPETLAFAEGKPLELVSGEQLVDFILQLDPDHQASLFDTAFDGDYSTPTCPQCGVKMTARVSRRGTNAGASFWGCVNFPRCRQTFRLGSKEM